MRKYIFPVGVSIWLHCFALAQIPEIPVSSKITNVTVFLNRAQVTNVAQVNLPLGKANLIFGGISAAIDFKSIQVTAKGNLTILSVKHQPNFLDRQKRTQKMKLLKDSLKIAQNHLNQLKAREQVIKKEEELLLANKAIGGDGVGVNVVKLKEVNEYVTTRLTAIYTENIHLQETIAETNQRIYNLQNQLNSEQNNPEKPLTEIIVAVQANANTLATFEINYIVLNAGWTPLYDIRAKNTTSPVALSYKANVFQNSGVDWREVKITLSTGNPSQSGYKPTLPISYVELWTDHPKRKRAMAKQRNGTPTMSSEEIAAVELEGAKPSAEPLEAESAQTLAAYTEANENALSTEFEISIPYTILTDGKPQLVDIKNYDLKTNYTYTAVPKLDPDAFLMANITGWEELSLLSGTANVYFENTFVGETFLNAQNLQDTLAVSLGRDKRIILKREKIKDFNTRKIIGNNIKQEYGFEISLRNTKKETLQITIEDNIPVSKNSQIEVELLDTSQANYDPTTGKLTWKLSLNPSESKKLVFRYQIKYPKSAKINIF
ncbi:MAG: DUF4139 domain-containing protein [Microscillaceae bacterium]|nr:DUF4139 domain-containing protein [Microscillaceae bacterium]MDW8460625.1 DUF4139 domain-containing protein [Cytophagales bacterium]